MIEYWSSSQLVAHVAIWRGLDGAARELREGCEQLEALGETAFLSTTAGELAEIEFRRGDREEAERWLRVAERTAAPVTSLHRPSSRSLAVNFRPTQMGTDWHGILNAAVAPSRAGPTLRSGGRRCD